MSDPCFIYPQWLAAKRKLLERLEPLTLRQVDVIDSFFRNCIFEIGCDHMTDKLYLESCRQQSADHQAYVREKQARFICETIFEKGLYLEQVTSNGFIETTRTTVLVCGVPLIVGPAERGGK